MEYRITVFTPTYNRARLLHRVYESLKQQTDRRFKWLVIDDGSTDDTYRVVEEFIQEGIITIDYIYKKNGGLHTGYNAAIERLDTELSVCIDSDDWMQDNAIEVILTAWDKYKAPDVAGLIGLDITSNGDLIGDHLPEGEPIDIIGLLASKTNRGDKKYVVRTDCYKEVAPMPVFPGERDFNPHYLILKLNSKYRFVGVDSDLCIVDYQNDGMTANQLKQYLNSPHSYAELRKVIISQKNVPLFYMIKTVIHYCSSCQIAHIEHYIRNSPKPFLTMFCSPLGFVLTKYIIKKTQTN